MRTTHPDAIIAEIHAVRDEYAARFNYDQDASNGEYVCHPARRTVEDSGNALKPQ